MQNAVVKKIKIIYCAPEANLGLDEIGFNAYSLIKELKKETPKPKDISEEIPDFDEINSIKEARIVQEEEVLHGQYFFNKLPIVKETINEAPEEKIISDPLEHVIKEVVFNSIPLIKESIQNYQDKLDSIEDPQDSEVKKYLFSV